MYQKSIPIAFCKMHTLTQKSNVIFSKIDRKLDQTSNCVVKQEMIEGGSMLHYFGVKTLKS